jgi:hypothetical protein
LACTLSFSTSKRLLVENDTVSVVTVSFSTSKRLLVENDTVSVIFTGATDDVDWVGLYLVGQTPGAVGSHDWSYHGSASDSGAVSVTPREAGEYYVVMLCCDGYTEVSERVGILLGE